MKRAILSEEALNAVMGYLGTKPYQEVYKLIEGVQSTAKPFVEPDESNPVDTPAE
jgi:hypothetical protein